MDCTGHVWLTGFGEIGRGRPVEMVFGNPDHLATRQLASLVIRFGIGLAVEYP